MFEAAVRRVIFSEPIRNLSQSSFPGVALLAALGSDAGYGAQPSRFDETMLDRFFERYADRIVESSLVARGREKLFVLEGGAAP
jgi:hypothetical protein